jgi:protein dithiol:quinone oxidoreductase
MTVFKVTHKLLNVIGLTLCSASLVIAVFYMEMVLHLKPCPLCILTRYVIVIMAIAFLAGLVDKKHFFSPRVYAGINLVTVAAGLVISGRHVWLEYHPTFACSIGPLSESVIDFLTAAFAGTPDCTENDWRLLGLTVPEQSLGLILVLALLVLVQLYLSLKERKRR